MFQKKAVMMSNKVVDVCSRTWVDCKLNFFELFRPGVDNSGFWRNLWQLKIPFKWMISGWLVVRVLGYIFTGCWTNLEPRTAVVGQVRKHLAVEEIFSKIVISQIIACSRM